MQFSKVNLIYFSATGSTRKIVETIAKGTTVCEHAIYDRFARPNQSATFSQQELAIIGIPVFSGRVPEIAKNSIQLLSGNNTPAIIVCVYGNRHYDDALLELKEIAEERGFKIIAAGAFVAQHSIMNKVAAGRPDASDLAKAEEFGKNSLLTFENAHATGTIAVTGNYPYRKIVPIPIKPKTDRSCNLCGLCARECPVEAIDKEKPGRLDRTKCISCAHCIHICPRRAKRFGGLLYRIASLKFTRSYSFPKEIYTVYQKQ